MSADAACGQRSSPAERLRAKLQEKGMIVVPGVGDPLSARIAHNELGFEVLFISGYYVSASLLGLPDADMLGYADMTAQTARIAAAVPNALLIVDGDTGYGGPMQVKRAMRGFAQAGAAMVMIEDQVAPKRCGHTDGKAVVSHAEALTRVQAALDAKKGGADILLMARTDSRATDGNDEARLRAQAFVELGADMVFLEAPRSEADMREDCAALPEWIPKMVCMNEWSGKTPFLSHAELEKIGFKVALYPISLLNASVTAMTRMAKELMQGEGRHTAEGPNELPGQESGVAGPPPLVAFQSINKIIGFRDYDEENRKYAKVFQDFQQQSPPNGSGTES